MEWSEEQINPVDTCGTNQPPAYHYKDGMVDENKEYIKIG